MNDSRKLPLGLLAVTPLALALAAVTSAQAATRTDLQKQNLAQLNRQYAAASSTLGAAAKPADRHAELVGLDAQSTLRVVALKKEKNGNYYRYTQQYRGIPVYGEQIVVAEDAKGRVRALFGTRVGGLDKEIADVKPKLTSAQALAIGKRTALGDRLLGLRTEREKSTQNIYIDSAGRAHMAYVVTFFADSAKGGNPTRPYLILDANSGKVLKRWEGLTTDAIGTGPGGNEKTGQYEWGSGGIFGFLDVAQDGAGNCTMENANVRSVNLGGGYSGTTPFSYLCPRNTFQYINGAYSPINDAHYFGGVIQNMYNAYTGANALTFQLVMRVHYGSSYENAFWDGSSMTFGDGASTFYPLVNADVSGHEVSHGYTEQHSGLAYYSQSGGINEAFSDMGGEATEFYWKGSNDFLVGAEIFKAPGQALRYMYNPPLDGISIDNAANYYEGLDVHYSSGVYNKAFYLLATTAGWNTQTAFQAFARANALYWTPSTTFNSGACGVQQAASDLGFNAGDVANAFSAVGVSCI